MSGRTRSVRLADVARRAGVSTKTASNVLNGVGRYSVSTAEAVRQAIAELDYRPNLAARSLRRGRPQLVGLVVPELDVDYFAEFARHVLIAATAHGMNVVVEQTLGDLDRELQLIDGTRSSLVDGVLLSPLRLTVDDLRAIENGPPVVLVGDEIPAGTLDHVGFDNLAAAETATRHLIARGCRRIAAVGAPPIKTGSPYPETMRSHRLQGLINALRAAGRFDPELIESTETLHYADGTAGVRRLLERVDPAPDGIFCFNDQVALGVLRGLADAGLRVPRDIAVIGFDGTEQTDYSVPRLTTMTPDKKALAQHAIMLLSRRLGDRSGAVQDVTVDAELIIRESTSGFRGTGARPRGPGPAG